MFDHLSDAARAIIDASIDIKSEFLYSPMWFTYTFAQKILDHVATLINRPKIARPACMMLLGETNSGKTELANRLLELYPRTESQLDDRMDIPVLYVQAPPTPDEGRFTTSIIKAINSVLPAASRMDMRLPQVSLMLEYVNTKLLIVDETQHINAVAKTRQDQFFNTIKYISNQNRLPVMALGTPAMINAFRADAQIANRFEPFTIPRWTLKKKETFRLLATIERVLPLRKQSNLPEPILAARVLSLSEGTIGEIMELLRRAALWAIKTQVEHINLKVLDDTPYMSPSLRGGRRVA